MLPPVLLTMLNSSSVEVQEPQEEFIATPWLFGSPLTTETRPSGCCSMGKERAPCFLG